jgi:hypothetical protein
VQVPHDAIPEPVVHEAPVQIEQPQEIMPEPPQAPIEAPAPVISDTPVPEPTHPVEVPQEAPAPQEIAHTPADWITNKHGIQIDRSSSHIYETGRKDPVVLYGGTPQEQDQAIERFFANPENQNRAIYAESRVINETTGKPEVHMYAVNQDTNQIVRSSMLRGHGLFRSHKPLSIDLDKFKRVIQ